MIFRPDLVLIDGSSYIYRAFHALPPLTTTKGKPTGATRGFASMLRKLISTYPNVPMVMIFDAKGPNFRNDFYKEYKANRPLQIAPSLASVSCLPPSLYPPS